MHPDRVYHVEHVVTIEGAKRYAVTDMIYDGKQPIAVLVWGGKPGKEYPMVSRRLDLVHLSELAMGR